MQQVITILPAILVFLVKLCNKMVDLLKKAGLGITHNFSLFWTVMERKQ